MIVKTIYPFLILLIILAISYLNYNKSSLSLKKVCLILFPTINIQSIIISIMTPTNTA